jgi:hypothetical protein
VPGAINDAGRPATAGHLTLLSPQTPSGQGEVTLACTAPPSMTLFGSPAMRSPQTAMTAALNAQAVVPFLPPPWGSQPKEKDHEQTSLPRLHR